MKKKIICALCSTFLIITTGHVVAEQLKWMTSPAGKMVQEARKATQQVPLSELKKVFDEDDDIVLLDVRTPREYEAVHIPGAVNLSIVHSS